MEWIIWLISLAWIAFGSLAILYTEQTRELYGKYVQQIGRIPLGAVAAVVGVLLIVAARGTTQAGIIVALGVLALLKGILIIWNPKGVYDQSVQWFMVVASDQTYRFMGIVTLVLGTALFSWA
jgi:uncharacterized protein YjeT (DUF2065 family)